jgi:hypothetical protein
MGDAVVLPWHLPSNWQYEFCLPCHARFLPLNMNGMQSAFCLETIC